MKTIVRWILVLPAAIAAWYLVFFAGIFVHGIVEHALCPTPEFISETCVNDRVIRILHGVIVLFVALSAVAVMLAVVITAPSEKLLMTWVAFAVGSGVAIFMAVVAKSPAEGAAAVAAGLLTALAIRRRLRRPSGRTTATRG